jgi:hypothetical protein
MQSHSADYDTTIVESHTAGGKLVIINEADQVVLELEPIGGSVTADRTAAQWRSFTAVIADPDGTLTPESIASQLGPGCRVQAFRWVKIEDTQYLGFSYTRQADWDVHTPDGIISGVVADSNGVLTLAWPF